ncbi:MULTISPECIES: hypothetical protein [Sphingomonas]|uniref:hypothetical protein n=1 Tax=Sphingomonas TaxID=13687 RepID=UPI0012E3AC1E|nr:MULTISPECIES: hypothetical protein [Sphingomonas]MBY0301921.1 hypothetical protein [Sphingomonas ginsenosidimutans]
MNGRIAPQLSPFSDHAADPETCHWFIVTGAVSERLTLGHTGHSRWHPPTTVPDETGHFSQISLPAQYEKFGRIPSVASELARFRAEASAAQTVCHFSYDNRCVKRASWNREARMKRHVITMCAVIALGACGRAPEQNRQAAESENVGSQELKFGSSKTSLPGWRAVIAELDKEKPTNERVNDVAQEALQLPGGAAPPHAPPPTPARQQAANMLASILPPIGSGAGASRVTQYEVNIDPPAGASYVGRATISFAGDPPVTVYYLKKPIARPGKPDAEGGKRILDETMDIVGLPTGSSASTSFGGQENLLAFCMARPVAESRQATCSASVADIPLLLVTTYPRQNDTDEVFKQDPIDRMIRLFQRFRT